MDINFLANGVFGLVLVLAYAIAMGFAVKSLALKKGYQISFAWGFFFSIIALLYWGLAPTHPDLQAQIIAEGVRRAGGPPQQ